jgi:FkbM family methyltransferase
MKHRKNDHVDLAFSFKERVKHLLVPPRLYIRYIAYKEKMRGERELSLLPHLVERRKISIDIGANKGAYTYFLSKLSREVLAFEPNPRIFPILEKAVAANVTAYPVALSDRSGVATFRIPKGKKGLSNQRGTLSEILTDEPYSEIEVETRRLGDYGLSNIGFIKIDVEGFEQHVIEGAKDTIRENRPILLVEIEEMHTGQSLEDSLQKITALGYRCVFIFRGALHTLGRFDIQKHNRTTKKDGTKLEEYVFNYIFLPE